MKGVALRADHDRMAGVGPAVVSDRVIVVAGEDVNDLALAFIAPLEADDRGVP